MLASWKVRVIYLSFVILMLICIIGISIISFFSFLVSTDAIRLRLARELSAWTGYNIELHQPLHFSFFPLKASLSDVLLEDDNNSHLMSAERIEVDLSISDALIGRLRFSETRIIHPRLMIDEPIKTVSGFFISLAHSEGRLGIAIRKVQELSNIDKLTELPAQPFGRILVKDATLIYPLSFGKTAKIANINAMIDWPDLKGSAVFKASGNWNREFVSLTIKADKALLLIGGGMSPLGLSLHSNYGDINFNGSAGILQQKNLNGHFTLHLSGWEQSLRWIKMEKILPNQRGTPLVWESSLEVSSEHISLNHIAFTLGKDKARGAIEVLFRKNLPMITGSLAFEKLDCNSIINALDDPIMINFSFLERFALDLRFSTGNTTIDSLNIENVAASIQMHDGLFVFDIGNATIFGGVVQLNVQLQRNKRFLKELEDFNFTIDVF
jgi:AsmA protein